MKSINFTNSEIGEVSAVDVSLDEHTYICAVKLQSLPLNSEILVDIDDQLPTQDIELCDEVGAILKESKFKVDDQGEVLLYLLNKNQKAQSCTINYQLVNS